MTDATSTSSKFPRWLKWSLLAALGVVVVFYGAILLYVNVIRDDPEEFDRDDLTTALDADNGAGTDTAETSTDTTQANASDTSQAPTSSEPADPADDQTTTSDPASSDSPGADTWSLTDGSQVGYRVEEVLFGVDTVAVGRTDQVEGSLTIDEQTVVDAEFVVDVASIESDDSRRDEQFRGRIMSTAEYPDATFALSTPIELGTEPENGVSIETEATGELTLRGVTNTVTFELTAEQQDGRIGVLGSIPVLFEDYEIENPSFGGITTEDNGLLEFVLVFTDDQ